MVIGYFVDGEYVTVGGLEHYIKKYGGKEIEVLYKS